MRGLQQLKTNFDWFAGMLAHSCRSMDRFGIVLRRRGFGHPPGSRFGSRSRASTERARVKRSRRAYDRRTAAAFPIDPSLAMGGNAC
jgi:hypothetical protein